MKKLAVWLSVFLTLSAPTQANVTIPWTFSAGQPIQSTKLNANFVAVANEINNFENLFTGGLIPFGVDTGTTNAYVVTTTYIPASLQNGNAIAFIAANTNTGPSTINLNGLGAVNVTGPANVPLWANAIVKGALIGAIYDGVEFQMVSNPSVMQFAAATSVGGVYSIASVAHNWVTGLGTTGFFTLAQPSFSDLTGSLPSSSIPIATTNTIGGIYSAASVAHSWINWIGSGTGQPQFSQPAFSDLSGTLTASQLPLPSTNTLGGVYSLASVAHSWVNWMANGQFQVSQPNYTDLTGTVPLAGSSTVGGVKTSASVANQFIDALTSDGQFQLVQPSFSNLSGVATGAQLPTPTVSTRGGIYSVASVSHSWINWIGSGTGQPQLSQPAFTDISSTLATGQLPSAITWPASGTVISFTPSNHGVLLSSSAAAGTVISPATATTGYVLTSTGTSSDPTWQNPAGGGTVTGLVAAATTPLSVNVTASTTVPNLSFTWATVASQTFFGGPSTGSNAAPTIQTFPAASVVVFTSNSGVWIPPAGVLWFHVKIVGGGAGGTGGAGSGSNNGAAGQAGLGSSFGCLNAFGGQAGQAGGANPGGLGGSFSIGSCATGYGIVGGSGGSCPSALTGIYGAGGDGGASCMGAFAGSGSAATAGVNAPVNSGGGGSGAGAGATGGNCGDGGGAGGCAEAWFNNIQFSGYSWSVGAYGNGGNAGTGGEAGGNGGTGIIILDFHYH